MKKINFYGWNLVVELEMYYYSFIIELLFGTCEKFPIFLSTSYIIL